MLERDSWLTPLRKAVDAPLIWFGVWVGAASAISAIARLLDVGLVGVFRDFVQFYRDFLFPLYHLVNLPPWPFHVPELAIDLAALYIVLVGMGLRSELLGSAFRLGIRNQQLRKKAVPMILTESKIDVLECLLLVPVITFRPLRWLWVNMRESNPRPNIDVSGHARMARRNSAIAFLALPAAIVIFFVLNAYAPSSP